MGLRRLLLTGFIALLVAVPVVAQSGSGRDFYPYRGYCGLAAVSIRLFGYAETVELGATLSGAPGSYVVSFISWCGSRGVGGDDNPSAGLEKRECTFSSDCSSCSVGNVVENSCINYKCVPPQAVEERCTLQSTTAGSYSFPNTCTGSGASTACGKDVAAIRAKRDELQKQLDGLVYDANAVTKTRETINALYPVAAKNCLSALSDVTNKLIVDTAVLASGVLSPAKAVVGSVAETRNLYGVLSDNTGRLVDELAKKAGVQLGPAMSTEEYISLNCNAEREIKNTEWPLLDKKFAIIDAKAKAVRADINALDAAL